MPLSWRLLGVKYLIDACNTIKRQNMTFTCDIIGGGEDYHALKNHINDLRLDKDVKLQEEVELKGWAEDVEKSKSRLAEVDTDIFNEIWYGNQRRTLYFIQSRNL